MKTTHAEDYCMVNVSEEGQVFECEICGNIVKVLEVGGGELICCGEPMVIRE
jgi:desulfoferrodoxin-like iron-binding protein